MFSHNHIFIMFLIYLFIRVIAHSIIFAFTTPCSGARGMAAGRPGQGERGDAAGEGQAAAGRD